MSKAVFSLLLVFFLAVPALAAGELAGGYYLVADSDLGNGVRFYIPADFADGALTLDAEGHVFNLTSSSIYLYSPSYPGYTIYAPRFSRFQYRASSGSYNYEDLQLRNISDTNVQLLQADPPLLPDISVLLICLVAVSSVIAAAVIFGRRR